MFPYTFDGGLPVKQPSATQAKFYVNRCCLHANTGGGGGRGVGGAHGGGHQSSNQARLGRAKNEKEEGSEHTKEVEEGVGREGIILFLLHFPLLVFSQRLAA